jgi:hypothetical protein
MRVLVPGTTARQLARLDIRPSRLRIADACTDALRSVIRSPRRSVLASLATALAVATLVATAGLADTARNAVNGTFSILAATEVAFTDNGTGASVLTLGSERVLDRLHGVREAGLTWQVDGGAQYQVSLAAGAGGAAVGCLSPPPRPRPSESCRRGFPAAGPMTPAWKAAATR